MEINLHAKPNLARGCRLREGTQTSLQIPEGQMKMSGAGLEILKLCDGQKSVQEILEILSEKYPPAVHERIKAETIDFLRRLNERAVVVLA